MNDYLGGVLRQKEHLISKQRTRTNTTKYTKARRSGRLGPTHPIAPRIPPGRVTRSGTCNKKAWLSMKNTTYFRTVPQLFKKIVFQTCSLLGPWGGPFGSLGVPGGPRESLGGPWGPFLASPRDLTKFHCCNNVHISVYF